MDRDVADDDQSAGVASDEVHHREDPVEQDCRVPRREGETHEREHRQRLCQRQDDRADAEYVRGAAD